MRLSTEKLHIEVEWKRFAYQSWKWNQETLKRTQKTSRSVFLNLNRLIKIKSRSFPPLNHEIKFSSSPSDERGA